MIARHEDLPSNFALAADRLPLNDLVPMRYGAPGLGESAHMMVLVFAALLAAFVCGWLHKTAAAIGLLALAFVLAAAQFLWETYSPQYGFAMPWIQVERAAPPAAMGEA